MVQETYRYVQVSGGKFHKLAVPTADSDEWRGLFSGKAAATVCGRDVKAVNLFRDREAALGYTGGNESYLCSQCESSTK